MCAFIEVTIFLDEKISRRSGARNDDDGARANRDVRASDVGVVLRTVVVYDNGRQQNRAHVLRLPVLPSVGDRPDVGDDIGVVRRQETTLRRVSQSGGDNVHQDVAVTLDIHRQYDIRTGRHEATEPADVHRPEEIQYPHDDDRRVLYSWH